MHAGLDKIYFDRSQTRHQPHLPPMQATPPFIERRENLFFWRRRSRFFPPRTSVHASSDPCGDVRSIIQPLEIAYHTSDPAFLSQSWQKRKVRAGLGIISFSSTCLARGKRLRTLALQNKILAPKDRSVLSKQCVYSICSGHRIILI